LYISLTADYSYASGLLTPTGQLPGLPQNGAVAGRLRVLGGAGGRSLAGARIVVVGAGGATSDASGYFYVGGIPPGVYEVYLDTEKLPLELAPLHWRRVVEVQAGLTTRVDFTLEERFGFAGQVRNAQGEGVAQLSLVLVDKAGQEVARTATDAFGYFRFDQIPPGTYRLRAVSPQGQTLAEKTVELREFLFGQDLQLP
jgi:protocatechuate 3,4-dioxygenase beta subunit